MSWEICEIIKSCQVEGMKTKVEYLYRDASNYKVWGEAVLGKEIKFEDFIFYDENMFLPTEIGLRDLRGDLILEGFELNNDDHPFHELINLEYL